METKIIEATNREGGGVNHGKFLLGRFDDEWARMRLVGADDEVEPRYRLLSSIGMHERQLVVLDLQACEGVIVSPGGSAHADLRKHQVYVCPLFEPFLEWLYEQDLSDLQALPELVNLDEAPSALYGYRRSGSG